MRKNLIAALVVATMALGAGGLALADHTGGACPDPSKNAGGHPSCGRQDPGPPAPDPDPDEVCPDGIVTGPADELTQGNLNFVLCPLHEGVEDITGIPF